MDMEARSVSPEASKALQAKVKEYRVDLANLKEQLKQAAASTSGGDAARAELVRQQAAHKGKAMTCRFRCTVGASQHRASWT